MRKIIVTSLLILYTLYLSASVYLASPNDKIKLTFEIVDGVPTYSVAYNNAEVMKPSRLGLELYNADDLLDGFLIETVVTNSFDETWQPVLGEYANIRNNYNGAEITLVQSATKRNVIIEFRVFDDGVGFRYKFDKQPNLAYFQVENERTEFAMTGDHKTFWIPGNPDSNEYNYTTTTISQIDVDAVDGRGIGTHAPSEVDVIQSPMLMKSKRGLYISIFEAALVDYSAMMLSVDKNRMTFTSELAPSAIDNVKAFMQTPCQTPWRTIIVSDDARDILSSTITLNLNEPCKIVDNDWIKPMKYVGIWWEMHVPNRGSWNYADEWNLKLDQTDWSSLKPNGRHAANTENTMRYIDFAAEHGFDGVLVEGWNVGWEDWAGNWKEHVFDFQTPYPDFDVQKISEYAKSKGVEMIMHHETSASATNYERYLDDAHDFMKQWGYNAVKTGYVGWIIPRGETHDGQWMVNHYNRVIQKAAAKEIMVNAHEQVRPTGISRTYPNLVACEAARGNEFNAWSIGNTPEHETILPFTRILGGGMDYTPGIFEIKMNHYQEGNECQVHTTIAKQLALYITMYSPLQMAADLPENYERYLDAFQFIKDVDVDWVDTKILEAEPGDYITIARKGKRTNDWYVGAITDENSRTSRLNFDFLDAGKSYTATFYVDGNDADWKENPKSYRIYTKTITSKSKEKIKLAAGGGYAISITEK